MESRQNKPGTLVFLATDIVGSTEQLERLGDEVATPITTMAVAKLTEIASHHGGEVFKNMGDGIMVVFGSALDAITCAVSMQQAHAADASTPDPQGPLPVRIGVHAGEPIRIDDDYFGMPINVLVKLSHVGQGGQVLVSDVVRGLVGRRGEFTFRDLGEHTLSGLRETHRLWEVVWQTDVAQRDQGPSRASGAYPAPRQNAALRDPDTVVILFVDIVDSMPQTARLGDAGFRLRARELDGLLRAHVREHRGATVEGKIVGDGVVATFPSARNAIACALQCENLAASVDLELHLGLHAGDVIRDGNNIYGGAVNIASRISDATNPGEILVSDTVRGLARTSAGVTFEDRGDYRLKGVEEPMRLFSIRT